MTTPATEALESRSDAVVLAYQARAEADRQRINFITQVTSHESAKRNGLN